MISAVHVRSSVSDMMPYMNKIINLITMLKEDLSLECMGYGPEPAMITIHSVMRELAKSGVLQNWCIIAKFHSQKTINVQC